MTAPGRAAAMRAGAMASIDLHMHEAQGEWLSPVCARCGARGRYTCSKTIVWSPWWMPLLVLATGFLILVPFVRVLFFGVMDSGRRVTVELPFCASHRNHWRWRSWPLSALLLLALGLIGAGIAVAAMARRWDPANDVDIFGRTIFGIGFIFAGFGVVGLLVWWVFSIIVPFTGIRIADVAGTALTLTGVSEAFCDAVAERRLQKPASADAPRAPADDDRQRRKRERSCPACGERYSRKRPRCPACGETNDLLR
jgi:hypothetical protein